MRRGLGLVLAAGILIVGACGDDDEGTTAAGDEATTTTSSTASTTGSDGGGGGEATEAVTGPAEISAQDQSGDGTTVEVASVVLPTAGFVAVHSDDGGQPGPVIGHSELLPEGPSSDVVVMLDEPLTADATVHPMAHVDANDDGEYDFDPPDVTVDVPATLEGGGVAMVPVAYTLDGMGGAADGQAEAGGAEVVAEGFEFVPPSVDVPVGTTVTWTNRDSAPHTVTAGEPQAETGAFHQALQPGSTAEITFDQAGTFAYFCSVHPGMRGEVVVS